MKKERYAEESWIDALDTGPFPPRKLDADKLRKRGYSDESIERLARIFEAAKKILNRRTGVSPRKMYVVLSVAVPDFNKEEYRTLRQLKILESMEDASCLAGWNVCIHVDSPYLRKD